MIQIHLMAASILMACLLLLLLGGQGAAASTEKGGWVAKEFPKPKIHGGRVSDPDKILSKQQRSALADQIESVETTIKIEDKEYVVEIAVAVMDQVNLESYGPNVDEEVAVENFARQLHDLWGVGQVVTSTGAGTGVLVFLSVYDRVIYISRGGALDRILTNARIDSVIRGVQPTLKQAKYSQGLTEAIEHLTELIQKGEPTWAETLFRIEHLMIFGGVGAFFVSLWSKKKDLEEQRAYAEAASQLSELDRAHAQALQGQYEAKSCPICLEDFKSSTLGSDDQPIKLLRCGHIFDDSCWAEWVSSGQGNVTICPICKKNVGAPITITTTPTTTTTTATATATPQLDNNASLVQHIAQEDGRDQDRVIQRVHQERNFRLARLAHRFPRYVTPNQLQRWTSPTYNGSLVRDSSFVQNNPRPMHQTSARRGGSSGSRPVSFGGGSSSGGRSGRF